MPGGRGWFMPMGGPLIPEGVMPAAMLAGFMLPPMEAGPRGPGWFMNWLLYAWVSGPLVQKFTLSMGFPRQQYWSGLPFPSPGDLLTRSEERRVGK